MPSNQASAAALIAEATRTVGYRPTTVPELVPWAEALIAATRRDEQRPEYGYRLSDADSPTELWGGGEVPDA